MASLKFKFLIGVLLFSALSVADTPPPGTVKIKGGTDGTVIGNVGDSQKVNVTNSITATVSGTIPVTGTFWQATQPISASSLPLPTGASSDASLAIINTTLGSPMQSGGSIGNSAFGISGSLPSFASTPTFNLGTLNGAATNAELVTINTTLGTPFQSGGSIGNSSFGISGSLPSFASTPTFNLGTLNGAATAANQSTEITALGTINTTLGTPFQSGGSIGNSSFGISGTLPAFAATPTVTANAGTGTFTVDASGHTVPVSGTFWQATQPVSGTFYQATQPVSGTFWQTTQPVSAASLPLPTLAATSTNQSTEITALGTINTTLGSPFQAGGSIGNTAFTANAGTNLNTSALNLESTQSAFKTANHTDLGTINTTLGTPFQTGGSIGNTAFGITGSIPAGANVIGHVIVDTAPTTAVSQSGTWTVTSKAGTPTALTVKQAALTIGTSAARLTNDGLAPASTRVLLVAQLLSTSTANCFFGSSGVANSGSTRGVQMFAGQTISFTNDAGDYYAICDTSSQTIFVTEQE